GSPPNLANVPPGCPFHPRCLLAQGRDLCRTELPVLAEVDGGPHVSACHFSGELAGEAGAMLARAEQVT
ncbi:MAG: ABC transporter ATP-binding protein, partial [Streptosporangiales bacterium]